MACHYWDVAGLAAGRGAPSQALLLESPMRKSLCSILGSAPSALLFAVLLVTGACDSGDGLVTPEEAEFCQQVADANGLAGPVPETDCRQFVDALQAQANGQVFEDQGQDNGSTDDGYIHDSVSNHLGTFIEYQ